MAWCPRCDVRVETAPGAPCPTCAATTFDPAPAERPGRRVVVLDAETPPAAPPATETSPEIPTAAPRRPRRSVAVALVLAILGAATLAATTLRVGGRRAAPAASATPTPTVTSAPPLGRPLPGSIMAVARGEVRLLRLVDGHVDRVQLTGEVVDALSSPDRRRLAYVDQTRLLWVVTPATGLRMPLVTEVDSFRWESDDVLDVVRSFVTTRGQRTRLERVSVGGRLTDPVLETDRPARAFLARGDVRLVELTDVTGVSSVHAIGPKGQLRLLRGAAALLDLSPDGRTALVADQRSPGLVLLDPVRGRARTAARLVATAARFSPDGRAAGVVGSASYAIEEVCAGDLGPCPRLAVPRGATLFVLDLVGGEPRALLEARAMSRPAWGPEGWLLVVAEGRILAVPSAGGAPVPIAVPGLVETSAPDHLA
jgi:hypothetical protein